MPSSSFHVLVTGIRWRERKYHWLRLMTLGCGRVTFETDAKTALHFLQSHVLSMLIVDLDRPELGGALLLRELADRPPENDLPIIIGLVTPGRFSHQELQEFQQVDRFLEKPIWYDSLKGAMEELLSLKLTYRDMPATHSLPDDQE